MRAHYFLNHKFEVITLINPSQGQMADGKYLGAIDAVTRDDANLVGNMLENAVNDTIVMLSENNLITTKVS